MLSSVAFFALLLVGRPFGFGERLDNSMKQEQASKQLGGAPNVNPRQEVVSVEASSRFPVFEGANGGLERHELVRSFSREGDENARKSPRSVSTRELALKAVNADGLQLEILDAKPGLYELQLASFRDRARAALYVNSLERRGHRAHLVAVNLPSLGKHYRVRVGPFATAIKAEKYRQLLRLQYEEEAILVTVKSRSLRPEG